MKNQSVKFSNAYIWNKFNKVKRHIPLKKFGCFDLLVIRFVNISWKRNYLQSESILFATHERGISIQIPALYQL